MKILIWFIGLTSLCSGLAGFGLFFSDNYYSADTAMALCLPAIAGVLLFLVLAAGQARRDRG